MFFFSQPPHTQHDAPKSFLALTVALLSVLVFELRPVLAEDNAVDNQQFASRVRPLLAKYCFDCHGEKTHEKDLRLDQLARSFDNADAARWQRVMERIELGQMPPEASPRPTAEEVHALSASIKLELRKVELARRAKEGRVVMRRLNRVEYQNTVRDLLGVEVDLEDLIPEEATTGGFDNSAEALHVSSYLMDNYLQAADRVLDAAIASSSRPETLDRSFNIKDERSVKAKGSVYRHVDDGVAIFSSWVSANIQVTLWQFQTRQRGRYRFRISAYGFQTTKPVTFHVMVGPMNAQAQQRLINYFNVPANEPTVVEFFEQVEAQQTIRIITDGLGALPPEIEKVGAENYKGPGLVVQKVDVQGPLLDSWPPRSHRLLFGDLPQVSVTGPDKAKRLEVSSEQPLADAERILRDFTRRAFRRSVTDDDIKPFLARVRNKLQENYSFEQSLRIGLKAVLVSPHFLFLRETRGAAEGAALDDFPLACRLSYFLWSSMPDDELMDLAEKGLLSHSPTPTLAPSSNKEGESGREGEKENTILQAQVERMLNDPKAAAFRENFVGQWLNLRAIDATTPDRMLYPEYDDILKVSMVKEVQLFFDEVLKNDLSVTNFVSSDFTMVNGRLARHYNIPGVDDELEFHKVALTPESHRGGVLTMGAVMKVTANGTTTSPVLRGAWVLDRILGTPPPKPTVDVEAVEPDIRGATTIRSQLAKHRDNAACAGCHAKIDPPGFALENFDVIGGWRDNYRSVRDGEPVVVNGQRLRYVNGPAVDASDVLTDGRRFQSIDQYKQLLLQDKDQLARALAGKLLAYSTGAAPTAADEPEVDRIVAKVRDKDYGLRSLVHEVVQSELFRRK